MIDSGHESKEKFAFSISRMVRILTTMRLFRAQHNDGKQTAINATIGTKSAHDREQHMRFECVYTQADVSRKMTKIHTTAHLIVLAYHADKKEKDALLNG